MPNGYSFADLQEGAVRELKQLEDRLKHELGEEITLIAYTKKERDSTACRADVKGD